MKWIKFTRQRSMPAWMAAILILSLSSAAHADWLQELRLTHASGGSYLSGNGASSIATDASGRLHLVWHDYRDGDAEVYYMRFNGAAWGTETRLTTNTTQSLDPAVAVDASGIPHVVWVDAIAGNPGVYYKTLSGSTWTGAVLIAPEAASVESPSIGADSLGRIHVVWRDYDGAWGVFYNMFDGITWSGKTRLSDSVAFAFRPSIAARGDQLHVVWTDFRNANMEVYYKNFDGTAWGADTRLTTNPGLSENPSVTVAGNGNVHVFWKDNSSGFYDIYHKVYSGGAWGVDEIVAPAIAGAVMPYAAPGSAGEVHLVWQDMLLGDQEVLYRKFDGGSWGPVERISDASGISENPKVTVDASGHPQVVWNDKRDGNNEIYWRPWATLSKPVLASVSPDSGTAYTVAEDILLTGGGFYGQVGVRLQKAGETGIVASGVHLESHSTAIAEFDLWGAASGDWDVLIENLDGQRDTLPAAFTVVPLPAPSTASVVPDSGTAYTTLSGIQLSGMGFHSQATAWLKRSGQPALMPDNLSVGSPTSITFDLDLWGVDAGDWDIIVENPDLKRDTLSAGFRVVPYPQPGVVSIAPDSGTAYYPVAGVTVAGSDFHPQAIAWLGKPGNPDLVPDNLSVDSSTEITFDLDLWGAAAGDWDVVVKNPDQQSDTLNAAFTVLPLPRPEIASIEPESSLAWPIVNITDIAGSDFSPWTVVRLQMAGENGIEASNLVVESPYKITCDFALWEIAAGAWDVVVENPDLQRDTLAAAFTVIPLPPLTVTSIDPTFAVGYQDVGVTDLAGTEFDPAAVVLLRMTGEDSIEAVNVVVESPTKITCDFRLTGAQPGFWDVVVKNPEGRVGVLAGGFEVIPSLWGDDTRLTYDSFESSLSQPNARCIAVDGAGHVHVVWFDNRTGNREIFYKMFDGASWSSDLRLTDAEQGSMNPSIAVDGNEHLHLVWDDHRDDDYEIYYKEYDGVSWSEDLRLTDVAGESRNPAIAAYGDNRLYVVWQDKRGGGGTQYIYSRIHDGSAWLPDGETASGAGSYTPSICLDDQDIPHVVWYRYYGGDKLVAYQRYDGANWVGYHVLALAEEALGPTIAAGDNDYLHAVWHAKYDGSNYEIFYRYFGGIRWEALERITDAPDISSHPSIAVDTDGNTHMVWCDKRDGNKEIYYARNDGYSWGSQIRLTKAAGESDYPFLAVGPDGAIHVIWRDYRDGNFEIYYKRRAPDDMSRIGGDETSAISFSDMRVVPNPVVGSAQVQLQLAARTEVSISIHDVSGRVVWTATTGLMEPGTQRISWNGNDRSGNRVAPGIYMVRCKSGPSTRFAKIVLLK